MNIEKRHIIILAIEVIILGVMFVFYINYKKGMVNIDSNNNSESTFNQTLEAFKNSEYFKEEYQDLYSKIKYQIMLNF